MDPKEREYTPEEVTAVMASALRRRQERDTVSHEDLLETAAELGVPPSEVEAAVAGLVTERDLERARAMWVRRQRQGFRAHAVSFVIVNAFLTAMDFLVSGGTWFYWPLLGWGIGLAFHAYATFFPDPEVVEEGAQVILRKELAKGETTN